MNTYYCKPAPSDGKRELPLVSKNSSGSVQESTELRRILEQVRNALNRLESELAQLEVILDAASQRAHQDEQERIQ